MMEICREFDQKLAEVVVPGEGSAACSPEGEETVTTEGNSSTSSNSGMPSGTLPATLQVRCRHLGCEEKVHVQDLKAHMSACDFRPIGVCEKGCGLPILQKDRKNENKNEEIPSPNNENHSNLDIMGNNRAPRAVTENNGHNCISALKTHVNRQQMRISQMQNDSTELSNQFEQRERHLLSQIAGLHGKVQLQTLQFKHKLHECRYKITYLTRKTTQHFVKVRFPKLMTKSYFQNKIDLFYLVFVVIFSLTFSEKKFCDLLTIFSVSCLHV